MTEGFVCHPHGTVDPPVEDYPDTGCYTLSAEEFAAADTQRAWSAVALEPDLPHRHDWGRMVKLASGIAAAALGVIALVAVLLNPPGHAGSSTTTTTATAMPASQLPPISTEATPTTPFAMPTVMAAHETADGQYMQLILRVGGEPDNGDWSGAISYGHYVCEYMRLTGKSATATAVQSKMDHPYDGESLQMYLVQVNAAVIAYCPELS